MHLKIRLKRDWPYSIEYKHFKNPICISVPAGSTGEYFAHTDCYLFESQQNCVPWINRAVVEGFGKAWFEPVD